MHPNFGVEAVASDLLPVQSEIVDSRRRIVPVPEVWWKFVRGKGTGR